MKVKYIRNTPSCKVFKLCNILISLVNVTEFTKYTVIQRGNLKSVPVNI